MSACVLRKSEPLHPSASPSVSPLRFVQEFDPEVQHQSAAGTKKMRDLCESALTAVGLHVVEGAKIWAIYRWDLDPDLEVDLHILGHRPNYRPFKHSGNESSAFSDVANSLNPRKGPRHDVSA